MQLPIADAEAWLLWLSSITAAILLAKVTYWHRRLSKEVPPTSARRRVAAVYSRSTPNLAASRSSTAPACTAPGSAATGEIFVHPEGEPDLHDFQLQDQELEALRHEWIHEIRPRYAPAVDEDPFLSPPDVRTLLCKILEAERSQPAPKSASDAPSDCVARAARRLESSVSAGVCLCRLPPGWNGSQAADARDERRRVRLLR
jgi:hypothetical protein